MKYFIVLIGVLLVVVIICFTGFGYIVGRDNTKNIDKISQLEKGNRELRILKDQLLTENIKCSKVVIHCLSRKDISIEEVEEALELKNNEH